MKEQNKTTAAECGTSTTATDKPNLSIIEEIELCALKNASTLKETLELRADTPEEASKRNRIICKCLDTFAAMREPFSKLQDVANATA